MARGREKLERAVAELEARELGYEALGGGTHDLVARVVRCDVAVWLSLDPATLLPTRFATRFHDGATGKLHQRLAAAAAPLGLERRFDMMMMRRMMKAELKLDDSLSFGAIARRAGHVVSLHEVTGGKPAESVRAKDWPVPNFLADELRFMLTDAGQCWGMLWLGRREVPFEAADIAAAQALGPLLGRATRMTFLRTAVQAGSNLSDPPGMVLLGEDGRVEDVSPEAENLVGDPDTWAWMPSVEALEPVAGARLIVDTNQGPVTVHTSHFGRRRALIIERTRAYVLADRLVRAYGLTPREREVVAGLSKGWSTRRIAFELDLADYTVQDHLRAVFDKIGVRSRKEVIANLFFEHYVPQHEANHAPSPYGWFLDGDGATDE